MKTKKRFEVVVIGFSNILNRCLTEVIAKNVNYAPIKKIYTEYITKLIRGDLKFDIPIEVCLYRTIYVNEASDYMPDEEPLMVFKLNALKPGRPKKNSEVNK